MKCLLLAHRTKLQESVNGNVAETCSTVQETRRITCVSVTGFVTFSRVSVAAYTTEPDHFLCMLNITETCDFVLCRVLSTLVFFSFTNFTLSLPRSQLF